MLLEGHQDIFRRTCGKGAEGRMQAGLYMKTVCFPRTTKRHKKCCGAGGRIESFFAPPCLGEGDRGREMSQKGLLPPLSFPEASKLPSIPLPPFRPGGGVRSEQIRDNNGVKLFFLSLWRCLSGHLDIKNSLVSKGEGAKRDRRHRARHSASPHPTLFSPQGKGEGRRKDRGREG